MDVRVIVKTLFNQAHLLCKTAEETSPEDQLAYEIRLKREAKNLRAMFNNPTANAVKEWIDGGDAITTGATKPKNLTNQTECRNYIAGQLSELGMKVNFGWLTKLCQNYAIGGSYGPLVMCIEDFCVRATDPNFSKDKINAGYIGAVVKSTVGDFRSESRDGPTCRQCGSPSVPDVRHGDKWVFVCSKGHKFVDA